MKRKTLGNVGVDGIPTQFVLLAVVNWIQVAKNKNHWQALVNKITKLHTPWREEFIDWMCKLLDSEGIFCSVHGTNIKKQQQKRRRRRRQQQQH